MAGLLHFLIVASFVWMLLEATQLFMLVRKLTKVQVIKRDGLPKPVLYIVGYGVPLIVVGVSALVYSDGYGATGDACWLSTTRNFNWALTGPVVAILAIVAQFVILGCTWILGLYQSNLFFQVLFIILNSQQGTFLFIVHCVLNKEMCRLCLKIWTRPNKKQMNYKINEINPVNPNMIRYKYINLCSVTQRCKAISVL
uniref:G-protein coupled receptors family 2 profile 2 domain-containing protein n=1 Tax=Periophthalmus magnuspinnatus TaxID=409849 RepID=A0A3B3Z6M7_9GOBI